MRTDDTTLLLKIRHPNVDPNLLTEAFGTEPECCWRAGDVRDEGGEGAGTRRESYWLAAVQPLLPEDGGPRRLVLRRKAGTATFPAELPLANPNYSGALESRLRHAALLFYRRRDLWSRLRSEGATAELLVMLADGLHGFEISNEALTLLANCGLSLSVDLRDAAEAAA